MSLTLCPVRIMDVAQDSFLLRVPVLSEHVIFADDR